MKLLSTSILLIAIIKVGYSQTANQVIDALWANGNNAFIDLNSTLYKTTDGGKTWISLTENAGLRAGINVDAINAEDKIVMIGTNNDDRLYRSEDFGESFFPITNGAPTINGQPASVPKIIENVNGEFFAGGTNMGVLRYSPSEKKWVETGLTGIAWAISHLGGDTIWTHAGGASGGPINFSHDKGATWTETQSRPQLFITATFTWPLNPSDFIKIGNRIVATNIESGGSGVSFTDDYGATWKTGKTLSIAKDLVKIGNVLYALDFNGVYESLDSAKTWSQIPDIKGNTMGIWKENKLLIGTSDGLIEYDTSTKNSVVVEVKSSSTISIQHASIKPEIFPNPATNSIQIKNIPLNTDLLIYNAMGQLIKTEKKAAFIDITDLKPGFYVLLTNNANVKPVKFLKQ